MTLFLGRKRGGWPSFRSWPPAFLPSAIGRESSFGSRQRGTPFYTCPAGQGYRLSSLGDASDVCLEITKPVLGAGTAASHPRMEALVGRQGARFLWWAQRYPICPRSKGDGAGRPGSFWLKCAGKAGGRDRPSVVVVASRRCVCTPMSMPFPRACACACVCVWI